jgi:hypothetical protein
MDPEAPGRSDNASTKTAGSSACQWCVARLRPLPLFAVDRSPSAPSCSRGAPVLGANRASDCDPGSALGSETSDRSYLRAAWSDGSVIADRRHAIVTAIDVNHCDPLAAGASDDPVAVALSVSTGEISRSAWVPPTSRRHARIDADVVRAIRTRTTGVALATARPALAKLARLCDILAA